MIDLIVQHLVMLPIAAALIAIWPALRRPSSRGAVAASAVGATAGLLIVLAYWLSGKTHPNAIAGLLQWNDAAIYLLCARELVAGAALVADCSMRPYYVAQFGALLAAAGGSLQAALLLQSALLGAASGWFAYLMGRKHGIIAGMAALTALLIFMAQFTLPVLTENAGLLLGLMSVAIIWIRAGSIAPLHFLAAMIILTLALNARAGAMLILPALLAWSLLWSRGDFPQRLKRSLYGLCGVVAAILVTLSLSQILGGELARSHSNFVYTLYAMSVNKSTYLQVYVDHPEVWALSPSELSRTVYGLIWDNLWHRPGLFILGYVRGGVMWGLGLFDFVPSFHVRAVFFVLAFLGGWSCLKSWREERAFLLLVMFGAVAVSSPFLFPYGGTRILATTFPVDVLLVARGAAYLMRRSTSATEASTDMPFRGLVGVATVIAMFPLPVILLLRFFPILSPIEAEVDCPAGQYAFVADLRTESYAISLDGNGKSGLFPLVVDRDRFVQRIHPATHQLDELKALAAGTALFDVMQRLPSGSTVEYGRQIRFLWTGPHPQGLVKGCVDPSPQNWLPVGTSLAPAG